MFIYLSSKQNEADLISKFPIPRLTDSVGQAKFQNDGSTSLIIVLNLEVSDPDRSGQATMKVEGSNAVDFIIKICSGVS